MACCLLAAAWTPLVSSPQSGEYDASPTAPGPVRNGELHVDEPEPPPLRVLHTSPRILRPPSPPQSASPFDTTLVRQNAGAGPSQQAAEDSDYASEYEDVTRD